MKRRKFLVSVSESKALSLVRIFLRGGVGVRNPTSKKKCHIFLGGMVDVNCFDVNELSLYYIWYSQQILQKLHTWTLCSFKVSWWTFGAVLKIRMEKQALRKGILEKTVALPVWISPSFRLLPQKKLRDHKVLCHPGTKCNEFTASAIKVHERNIEFGWFNCRWSYGGTLLPKLMA